MRGKYRSHRARVQALDEAARKCYVNLTRGGISNAEAIYSAEDDMKLRAKLFAGLLPKDSDAADQIRRWHGNSP